MKDILVLLVLLNAQTIKVCSLPYQADGKCLEPTREYWLDGPNLCCKKCHPGQRLKQHCSETTETVCEECPSGQYMETMNYSPNCFSCNKCKSAKGLLYAQNCSATIRSKCGCQGGMYCIMGFDDPYCTACNKYRSCRAGNGVSVPGKADSDVKCERCPDGTFSDTVSHMDRCQPHKNCNGKVVRKGNTTSDNVCESEPVTTVTQPPSSTKKPHTEIVSTTASRIKVKVSATSDPKAPRGLTDSATSISHLSPIIAFNHSTKSPSPSAAPDSNLAAVTASVVGLMLLLIIIILLIRCKLILKKDAERFPKVDANGNCDSADKINPGYLGEIDQTSFTVISPEQHCLLEKGGACTDRSLCGNNTETLFRENGCSGYESIGPLQSTLALHNPSSALSEPMTLLSNTEPVSPQASIPTQSSSPSSSPSSSSQPTSPQIISPVTTSPHVNVNITVHIGNGTAGTPSVMPTDLIQVDSELPFGEEEESFSIPQQEAGKQSLMSVQESESYSA
ncbi:tumor necrosis factor receptor superfamily member 1B [Pempheris klunzingeri]|uniref:tumor necrosis factor receptor superfamily member 1B n=1 Tax=Pempheris klunzingeri TaxID=3127111 RepID=UPI00397EF457